MKAYLGEHTSFIAEKAKERGLSPKLLAFIYDIIAELRTQEGARKLRSDEYVEEPKTLSNVLNEMRETLESEMFWKKKSSMSKLRRELIVETEQFVDSLELGSETPH